MKLKKYLAAAFFACTATSTFAQEENNQLSNAYISDDLFIYMLAGPGSNYRILGTINAGTEISLTGESKDIYTQIVDPKNRKTWVETKYLETTPGLRFAIAELNAKLAEKQESEGKSDSLLLDRQQQITQLSADLEQANKLLASTKLELTDTKAQLKTQDTDIKKQWFFNGAIVLGIGLLLGLIIPKLTARKRANMDSWK